MSVELKAIAIQSSDNSIVYIKDITGGQSSGNPNGWNGTNENVSHVSSVTIGGTFRPYPSNSAPINMPATTLMPNTWNPLPYSLWQEFVLTPTLLSLSTTTFQDGIYTLLYTVNTSILTIGLTYTTYPTHVFSIGDTITDVNTGKVLGVVSSITTGMSVSMILSNTTGFNGTNSDIITNGVASAIFVTGVFTNNTYTYTIQQLITSSSDACLANNLSKIDPFCDSCGDTRELYCQSFITLMSSKAQAANQQNNSSLDSLYSFNTKLNCNNCGC